MSVIFDKPKFLWPAFAVFGGGDDFFGGVRSDALGHLFDAATSVLRFDFDGFFDRSVRIGQVKVAALTGVVDDELIELFGELSELEHGAFLGGFGGIVRLLLGVKYHVFSIRQARKNNFCAKKAPC